MGANHYYLDDVTQLATRFISFPKAALLCQKLQPLQTVSFPQIKFSFTILFIGQCCSHCLEGSPFFYFFMLNATYPSRPSQI